MMLATVLYEDQRGDAKNFGPHVLLLACVGDLTRTPSHRLKTMVTYSPRKGYGNLSRTLKEDLTQLNDRGPVYVMFDDDRVRTCYGLRQGACRREVLKAISDGASGPVRVVLLENNLEDLIRACCDALNQPQPRGKPTPNERDLILSRVAWADIAVRERIRREMPTFGRLVDAVAEWVREQVGDQQVG